MKQHLNSDLIARYLAGESDAQETQKVEQWMQDDPQNRMLMEELRKIWDASGEDHDEFNEWFDAEKDWQELRSRINEESAHTHSADITSLENNYSKISKTHFSQLLRVAAIILVAAFLGVLSYQNLYQEPKVAEPVLREISMDKGQRGNVTLSDGTTVALNAESSVILPSTFDADKRVVTLRGEAFFNVAHNPDRPFIIKTDDAVIEVLGTSFDVKSYPDEESVQVVVRDGRVSFASKKEKTNAILSAGQKGQLAISENRITTAKVEDFDLYLGWKEGFLKFRDTPMGQVAKELERKYDIAIAFNNPQVKKLRLTAELKSRTLKYNLDVIATSLNMDYKMDQQKVTFMENNE